MSERSADHATSRATFAIERQVAQSSGRVLVDAFGTSDDGTVRVAS